MLKTEALISFIIKWQWIIELPVIDLAIIPEHSHLIEQINLCNFEDLQKEIHDLSLFSGEYLNPKEKSKKEHEINLLSSLIENIAHETKIVNLIDVGCGNGYLEELLVHNPQIKAILGIDCSKDQISASITRNSNEKCSFLCEKFTRNSNFTTKFSNYGLVSLHGCGDLWQEMIMHWSMSKNCKFVISVPCCYNLISPSNLPLSKKVKNLQMNNNSNNIFTSKFRMLACQRPESQKEMSLSIKSVIYRTILQRALFDCGIFGLKVGRIRMKDTMTLEEYFTKAKMKINIPFTVDMEIYCKMALNLGQTIGKLWEIRAWIGTIAESLIVADRMEFLCEMKQSFPFESQMIHLFNRKLSPRNICITCIKH